METKEPQYEEVVKHHQEHGSVELGKMLSHTWYEDPRRLGFVLARYKFVSKMLVRKNQVLEIGCNSGFASCVVRQTVNNLTAIDFDPIFIEEAKKILNPKWPITFVVHDIVEKPFPFNAFREWDAIYSLDVLEHIPKEQEQRFMSHMYRSLDKDGILIIGTPNKSAESFASKLSMEGHVNLKTQEELRKIMSEYFKTVFSFGMNDEVLTTGFGPMCHYLFCIGISKR
jgi:2-polyprenyl-3-methyl-5-hydroxy-6-metoxy-1,4-benzoquinol methylase